MGEASKKYYPHERLGIMKEPPVATLERLLIEHPFIQPVAREMAKLGQLHHPMNVATVYENTISTIISEGLVKDYIHIKDQSIPWLIAGIGGALFHDIGKLGIDPKGMTSSTKKIEMNSIISLDPANRNDLRHPHLREEQHNHSVIGGHMLINLEKMGVLPTSESKLIKLWSDIAFGHHENNLNGNKQGYPRKDNGKRKYKPEEFFVIKLVQMSDAAVAMRERRTYRNEPLSYLEVISELETYLSDPELSFMWQVFNSEFKPSKSDFQKLRMALVTHIVKSAFAIDQYIRDIDLTSKVSWLKVGNHKDYQEINERIEDDDRAKNDCPIMDSAINKVWEEQRERLLLSIDAGVNNGFIHLTRS